MTRVIKVSAETHSKSRGRPSKAVVVKGKRYESLTEAAAAVGVAPCTIHSRIHDPDFPGYRYAKHVQGTTNRVATIDGIRVTQENVAAAMRVSYETIRGYIGPNSTFEQDMVLVSERGVRARISRR